MKKAACSVLVALFVLAALQHIALADSPAPNTTITIRATNVPAGAAYIDILVDKSLDEIDISSPNPKVAEKYPALSKSDLHGYNNGGYVSYSLYYKPHNTDEAYFEMKLSTSEKNAFTDGGDWDIDSIKIALLNGSGKILQVSDAISLQPADERHTFQTPRVYYDCRANTTQVYFPLDTYSFGILFLIFFALVRITVSTGIEGIIALPFKIKPLRVIVLANLFTQIIISIGIPWMTSAVPYAVSVTVFEALVYVMEFGAYMLFLRGYNWKRILFYTVVANTASLLIGLGLNALGLFWA